MLTGSSSFSLWVESKPPTGGQRLHQGAEDNQEATGQVGIVKCPALDDPWGEAGRASWNEAGSKLCIARNSSAGRRPWAFPSGQWGVSCSAVHSQEMGVPSTSRYCLLNSSLSFKAWLKTSLLHEVFFDPSGPQDSLSFENPQLSAPN